MEKTEGEKMVRGHGKRDGKRTKRAVALCLLLCALLSMLCACGDRAPDPLAFQTARFAAELRGSMTHPETGEQIEFCAKLEVRQSNGMRAICLQYLAPDRLAGVELEALCTERGEVTGDAILRGGGLSVPTEARHLSGLLMPATALLSPRTLAGIRRLEDGWEARYEDGTCIRTDPDGSPRTFDSPEISFDIVWYDERGAQ